VVLVASGTYCGSISSSSSTSNIHHITAVVQQDAKYCGVPKLAVWSNFKILYIETTQFQRSWCAMGNQRQIANFKWTSKSYPTRSKNMHNSSKLSTLSSVHSSKSSPWLQPMPSANSLTAECNLHRNFKKNRDLYRSRGKLMYHHKE
jgi:hypothetical protein